MKKVLNILLGVLMLVTVVLLAYAIISGGSEAAIGLNLIWGYALLLTGVGAAVIGALYNMVQSPAGAKSSLLSFVLILIVIGVAYFISAGHTVNIVDLQNNGFFAQGETVITETCVLVSYVAFAAAVLSALVTEIWAAFK